MFRSYKILCFTFFLNSSILFSQSKEVFKEQTFGKGSSSYYIGSGAFKRHLDLNRIGYKIQEYSKSPAIVIGADFCIYPHASNAYLGLGPYFSSWIGIKETTDNNRKVERLFSNSTLAIKFTHHASFFVRKKLDVNSGYIAGINLKHYHNYKIDGKEIISPENNNEIVPALGITITIKYYAFNNFGFYLEGGIGYRINMLNVGFCYKFKKKIDA
jgi:hypothetical protein